MSDLEAVVFFGGILALAIAVVIGGDPWRRP